MPKSKIIKKVTDKKSGASTRDNIVNCAREILNNVGVIDFRIEMLASELGLSPGNITYHFPRKEEIISAVWDEAQKVHTDMTEQIDTPLLDIKQLFLLHRASAIKSLDYVGVNTYYYGDVGNLKREWVNNKEFVQRAKTNMLKSYDVLCQNGYMTPIEDPFIRELTFETQFAILRWWYNLALLNCDIERIKKDIDKYVISSIFPLVPYLTENGLRQFESIKSLMK